MDYQKITFFLENIPNQLSKFRSKSWVEIIDGAWTHVQQITPIAKVIKLEAIISKSSSSLI